MVRRDPTCRKRLSLVVAEDPQRALRRVGYDEAVHRELDNGGVGLLFTSKGADADKAADSATFDGSTDATRRRREVDDARDLAR